MDYKIIIGDPGFLAGMAAALISFIASITLAVAQRHKVKLAFIFIIVGCLTLSAQRWLTKTADIEENRLETEARVKKAELENFRTNLMEKIKSDVSEMKVSVNSISTKLEYASLSSLGHELVDIEKGEGRHSLTAFQKGSPDEWQRFAQWLTTGENTKSAIPCLSLYVNSGHYYRIPLLLAYIMTESSTSGDIGKAIQSGQQRWETFPYVDHFFQDHGHLLTKTVELGDQRIGYVLFFDRSKKLIGYADAMDFSRELLVYQAIEKGSNSPTQTEQLFQHTERGNDPANEIGNAFSSFRKIIIRSTDTKEIVTQLIKSEQTEAIAIKDDNMFVIKVERMIKLATES